MLFKSKNALHLLSYLSLSFFLGSASLARQDAPTTAPTTAPATKSTQPAFVRVPTDMPGMKMGRDGNIQPTFKARHEAFLKRGKAGKIGVLFLGDSITEGWTKAKDVWQAHYGKDDPANFGIGGDTTQNVLWRIDNGELDGITPRVLVLMIGTNNIGFPAADILKGDTKIVDEIHAKLPDTKLLLLAVFPRGADPKDAKVAAMREKLKTVNAGLAKLDDGNKTRYLDFGDKFLDADGVITKEMMPDALHPTAMGYAIWADAMQPLLDEMMK